MEAAVWEECDIWVELYYHGYKCFFSFSFFLQQELLSCKVVTVRVVECLSSVAEIAWYV